MESWQIFFLASSIYIAASLVGPSNSATFISFIIGTGLLGVTIVLKALT